MGYFSELHHEAPYLGEPEPDTPPAPEPAGDEPQQEPAPPQEPAPVDPAPLDDTAARQAHEAAEAQRRREWDAAQAKKRAEEQEQLEHIASMNEDALRLASVRRISVATDQMTNRSMKDSVAAHIQSICEHDLDFARLTLHPRKSMLHCIQYIFRQNHRPSPHPAPVRVRPGAGSPGRLRPTLDGVPAGPGRLYHAGAVG